MAICAVGSRQASRKIFREAWRRGRCDHDHDHGHDRGHEHEHDRGHGRRTANSGG
jgi:hypothetical protein